MRIEYNLKFGFFFRNLASTRKGEKLPKLAGLYKNDLFVVLEEGDLRLIFFHKSLLAARNKGLKACCDAFAN